MLKAVGALSFFTLVLGAQEKMPALSCDMVPGWTKEGPARSYTVDNLFEYMDGNSEGYFRYHFQEMLGITCRQGETSFVLDISDMESSEYAYGLFTSNRDLREPESRIGMGGQIVPRRLIFAKGKFYVEIAANPEGDFTSALKLWAAALEKAVPGSSQIPVEPSWFRKEKLESLRLAPESVLGLRILKRGYVAQYEYGKAFLAIEESPAAASAVMQQFKARFPAATSVKVADEAFLAADQYLGKLCVFRNGRYIGGYAISGGGPDAMALSTELSGKIR